MPLALGVAQSHPDCILISADTESGAVLLTRQVAAALPNDGNGPPVDPETSRPDEERFTVRVRVVVANVGRERDTDEPPVTTHVVDRQQLGPPRTSPDG